MRTIAYWLSLVLIFVIPWENMVDIEGVGTLSKAIGLLVAVIWLVTVVNTDRFRKPHPFHFVVLLFVMWNTVSVFWSVDVDSTVDSLMTYFQLFGLVFIIWDLYTSQDALKAGLQAYILGGYVAIGSVLVNFSKGITETGQRYTATGFNGNDLSLILALGIPVAWYLATSEGVRKADYILRLVNYAYIPASFVVILLTASRSAAFALIPAFLFVLWSLTRLKIFVRILLFVALVGCLYAVLPMIPETSFHRIATTDGELREGDLNERAGIWREAIIIFYEHPLVGVGSGAFRRAAVETGKSAHNFALTYLAETGIIGFSLFIIILAMAIYHATKQPKWHSRLWLIIIAIWIIGAATHNLEHRKQTWLFLSLIIVSASHFAHRDESMEKTNIPVDSPTT